jgi:hypothetical protein
MNPMFYVGVFIILTVISLDAYLKRRKRKRDNYLHHTTKKS